MALPDARTDQVGAPYNFCNPLRLLVDHTGQLVADQAIGSANDEIADVVDETSVDRAVPWILDAENTRCYRKPPRSIPIDPA